MNLTIDTEFQSLIPPLQPQEYRQLEENILNEGCTHPIDVWDGVIVDGHNRYKICKEHDLPFECTEKEFESRDAAKIWIIKNQFGRRNLSNFHRAELALVLEPLIAAKAKARQIAAQNNEAGKSVRENSRELEEKGRTDETLAQIAGISSNTIRRAKLIKEQGTPEQIELARSGQASVNAIYTEIKHKDISSKICPMCGKELPIDRFYGEGATCKTCTEIRKQELLSGGTVSYDGYGDQPKPKRGQEPKEEERPEFTAEDLKGLLECAVEAFQFALDQHLRAVHMDILATKEGNEVAQAVLKQAEGVVLDYLKHVRSVVVRE